jgi:hypothetical protein
MSLNNHVIRGNIVPVNTSNPLYGYFTVNINPSLTTSFIDIYSTKVESNQEYYVACISIPESTAGITDDTINTLIIPAQVLINDTELVFYISSIADTLYIYKLPGDICGDLSYSGPFLLPYLFSSLQPEATYDISQLIYETP